MSFWTQPECSLPRRSVDTVFSVARAVFTQTCASVVDRLYSFLWFYGLIRGRLHSLTSRQRVVHTHCRWIASELLFRTPCTITRQLKPFLPGHKKIVSQVLRHLIGFSGSAFIKTANHTSQSNYRPIVIEHPYSLMINYWNVRTNYRLLIFVYAYNSL